MNVNIEHLQFQVTRSLAWAQFWTAYATSDANKARVVRLGGSEGRKLLPAELEEDAFNAARDHLNNLQELESQLLDEWKRESK